MMVLYVSQVYSILPLSYQFYAAATRQRLLQETFQSYFGVYSELLEELLRQGIEQGEIKPLDKKLSATQLIAFMEGMFLLWILYGKSFDAEKFVRAMVDTVFDGLALESVQ
jgi:hypothetical protein